MDISDSILIVRLKEGEVDAFNELYKRYHARVLQLGIQFLPYKEDAEEIVQMVFIALWDNRAKIDENQNFGAYIQTIARHCIYNALRKAVYRQGYVDYIQKHDAGLSFVTEEVVMFDELDSILQKIVENLPPKRREIFRLHREEGLTYKEISDRLSITGSTINTQLTKALDYIRQNIRLFYRDN